MSKFSKACDKNVRIGLNFSEDEWKDSKITKAEYTIGKFDSGFIESKQSRRLDRRIFSGHIYGISRGLDIEYMGSQHLRRKYFIEKYGRIEGIKHFKDQVMRDQWQTVKSALDNQICIWIMEPTTYVGVNDHSLYDTQIAELNKRLSNRGYLYKLLYECEKTNAKGVVIYWDHHSTIITKSFPSVKL